MSATPDPGHPRPVARTVTATGTVNPVLTIIVGTYVSGVIQQLFCDYNTQVKKDQICARSIRALTRRSSIRTSHPGDREGATREGQRQLGLCQAQQRCNLRLAETNAVSKDTSDNAKNLYDQAQAQIEFDKATIDQRQAELDAAQINLDYTNITSPVDGTWCRAT